MIEFASSAIETAIAIAVAAPMAATRKTKKDSVQSSKVEKAPCMSFIDWTDVFLAH